MKPKVSVCEDANIQASTHEPEDMRMKGCGDIHINLRIQKSMEPWT